MSRKLKYWLPAGQMAVAIVLLWVSAVWELALMRRTHGTVGPLPTSTVLFSLNAPVAALRQLFWRTLGGWWDYILIVAGVGILWYWVALNILSWKKARAVITFARLPLRIALDLLWVVLGSLLGLLFASNFYVPYGISPTIGWKWFGLETLMELPTGIWSVALVFLFTRDLYYGIRQGQLAAHSTPRQEGS